MSGWGGDAGTRNWKAPSDRTNPWQPPGHNRMFRDHEDVDNPNRAFTTRKKHGWWGKEERYDLQGREID